MIVFDVDGTLIGGEAADWASFDAAFEEVAGFVPVTGGMEEITAQAIVHQALGEAPLEEKRRIERAVCRGYLQRLTEAHRLHPAAFPAITGAVVMLQELKRRGMPVAFATGDWRETISFKLWAAGVPFEDLPMVTSTEFYSRADIIARAAAIAGRSLGETIYVGDGLWDLRASRKLGIPFVGVGRRLEQLRGAGAVHVLHELDPDRLWSIYHGSRQVMDSAGEP